MRVGAIGCVALLAAGLLVLAGPAAAETLRNWRLSFEVLSSQHPQPNGRKATYQEKDALTRAVLAEIVPHVWTTLGSVAARARSRVQPGGYGEHVNPAIHSSIQISENEARRLGAALGYVFRQYSVIMYDLAAEQADLRQVTVRFPAGTLTPDIAKRFFDLARATLKSNKLGFSATRSRMIFININTGIPDGVFASGLSKAASGWPNAEIRVDPPKPVRAHFIENDWDTTTRGEDYVRELGPNGERLAAVLSTLQRRHDGRVRRWAALLTPARMPRQRATPAPVPAQPQQ